MFLYQEISEILTMHHNPRYSMYNYSIWLCEVHTPSWSTLLKTSNPITATSAGTNVALDAANKLKD